MLKTIKFSQKDLNKLFEVGVENAPCICWIEIERNVAVIGDEELCDYNAIDKENVDIFRFIGNASTVIASKGDIEIGIFGNKELCEESLKRVSNKISQILTSGKMENNDFMYNGNKYGSSVMANVGNDVYWLGIHISNSINEELIEKICKKKMHKKPTPMPRHIYVDEILDLFEDYL